MSEEKYASIGVTEEAKEKFEIAFLKKQGEMGIKITRSQYLIFILNGGVDKPCLTHPNKVKVVNGYCTECFGRVKQ